MKECSFFLCKSSTDRAYNINTTLNYSYRHTNCRRFGHFDAEKWLN